MPSRFWLLLPLFVACRLPEEAPAPATPPPAPSTSEPAQLPPEETPPEAPETPAPAASPKPVEPGITSTGAPTRGTLPKAIIDERLKSAGPKVQGCYEQALQQKPDLRGSVNINFVVGPEGKVVHADVLQSDDALADDQAVECILDAIKALEFPEPKGGRVFINYPLHLEPPKP